MLRTVLGRACAGVFTWAVLGILPLLFLSDSSALGQTGPATAVAAERTTTVVSNVDEVAFDLVAYDKKGNLVSDLKLEDVEIVDGGSPIHINDLRITQAFGAAHPHPVTLLFDRMEAGNARSARDLALEILKSAPAAGVSFSVFKVGGRLHLMQAPTSDREALKKAVSAATVASSDEAGAQAAVAEKQLIEDTKGGPNQTSANALMAMLVDSQKAVADPHTTPSIAALLAVSKGQRGPGRKTVVYFSQGLAWNVGAPEMVRAIIQDANQFRVSIYALDAHVVDAPASNGAIAAMVVNRSANAGYTGISPTAPTRAQVANADARAAGALVGTIAAEQAGRFEQAGLSGDAKGPLESICQLTGGSHEYAGDTRKSARRIVSELESYYVASFNLPAQANEGRFRPVKVRALRPGVVLEARAGYFVPARKPAAVSLAFEGRLLGVLAAPQLPAGVQFRSAVLHFGNSTDGSVNSLVIEAPLSDVDIQSDAAAKAYAAHLAVLAQVKSKAGALVERFTEDLPRTGAIEEQQQARRDVVTLRRHFNAAPGDYVLETVALDVNGGKMAAQRTDFAILPAASGPSLSDVVLVRRIDPFADDEDADRSDPLRCVEGRVIPDLSGHVSKAARPNLALFFDIFPDRGSSEKPAIQAQVVRKDPQGDTLVGAVPLTLPEDSGRPFIPYLAQLSTAPLRSGAYRLTVVLKQGSKTVSQGVSFVLEP